MLTKLCRERVTLRYVSSYIFLQEVQELMGSFNSSKEVDVVFVANGSGGC